MNNEYESTNNEAKFQGFMLGVDVAVALADRGEKIDLNAAVRLMGAIADSVETLVDPEQSLERWDPKTAKLLRDGKINSIEIQRRHAQDAREGLENLSS